MIDCSIAAPTPTEDAALNARDARLAELQRKALDRSRLTLEDFVRETGLSRSLIEKHRRGPDDPEFRFMTPETAATIAAFLREHGSDLVRIADELESAAAS